MIFGYSATYSSLVLLLRILLLLLLIILLLRWRLIVGVVAEVIHQGVGLLLPSEGLYRRHKVNFRLKELLVAKLVISCIGTHVIAVLIVANNLLFLNLPFTGHVIRHCLLEGPSLLSILVLRLLLIQIVIRYVPLSTGTDSLMRIILILLLLLLGRKSMHLLLLLTCVLLLLRRALL